MSRTINIHGGNVANVVIGNSGYVTGTVNVAGQGRNEQLMQAFREIEALAVQMKVSSEAVGELQGELTVLGGNASGPRPGGKQAGGTVKLLLSKYVWAGPAIYKALQAVFSDWQEALMP